METGRPRIGLSELNLGVPVPAASLVMLSSRLARNVVEELVVGGDGCTAERARDLGIVHRSGEPGQVVAKTERELNRLARDIQLRDVEKVHRERSLTWKFDEELPVFRLYGQMPAADGVELVKAITRYANQAPPQPDGTYELFEARCVDALLQLASEARGADSDPDRATAVMHIRVEDLTSTSGSAESEDGIPLHVETARRLVCDARLQLSIDDPAGTVIGIGRTGRNIPSWLARVIRNRDRGCRYPGCRRQRWVHAHHLIHWAHGGPTNLDNLISLCPYHHRLVHEGGWRISGDPKGEVTWVAPGGTPFIPNERFLDAAQRPINMLEDFSVPDDLKGPDPPDTS
jgi:hypothetical protein